MKTTGTLQVLYCSDFTVFSPHCQSQKSIPSAGCTAVDLGKCLFFLVSFHLLNPSSVVEYHLELYSLEHWCVFPQWACSQLSWKRTELGGGLTSLLLLHRVFLSSLLFHLLLLGHYQDQCQMCIKKQVPFTSVSPCSCCQTAPDLFAHNSFFKSRI